MPLQDVTIRVDIPEGYEATGEPTKVYSSAINKMGKEVLSVSYSVGIDLRKKWTPPDWLKPGTWVWPNAGDWFASNYEPMDVGNGNWNTKSCVLAHRLTNGPFNFTPPPERRPYQVGGE